MNIHVPTPAPAVASNRHPADELKSVRDEIKDLEKKEKALKALISSDREPRVGDEHHAIVSERSRDTVDWKSLALSLGATDEAIKAATKTAVYEVVEFSTLPDLGEVLRLLQSEDLSVVDCETTGFSPAKGDRIVSVGVLSLESMAQFEGGDEEHGEFAGWALNEFDAWQYIVNPGRPSSPQALAVHGLTEALLADQPAFSELAEYIWSRSEGSPIVAHNAPFDVGFLNAEFERCGEKPISSPVIDTRVLSKVLRPSEPATLDAMATRLGVDLSSRATRHDALDDCGVLAACLPGLVALLKQRI